MENTPFGVKALIGLFLLGILYVGGFLFAGHIRVKQDEKKRPKKKLKTRPNRNETNFSQIKTAAGNADGCVSF